MNVALVYPYIASKAELYRRDFRRFVDTSSQFPADIEHTLFLTVCNGPAIADEDRACLDNFYRDQIIPYNGEGWDIGAHQHAANSLPEDFEFVAFCSSQTYFHRRGWLRRLVEAREKLGPGLYGGLSSFENRSHLRTCFFGCDPADLRAYPWVINSKELSLEFESGKTGFWTWIQANGRKQALVTWDEFHDRPEDWRKPENGFRNGDQSNCLVWDRHTQLYAQAVGAAKATLEQLVEGKA